MVDGWTATPTWMNRSTTGGYSPGARGPGEKHEMESPERLRTPATVLRPQPDSQHREGVFGTCLPRAPHPSLSLGWLGRGWSQVGARRWPSARPKRQLLRASTLWTWTPGLRSCPGHLLQEDFQN